MLFGGIWKGGVAIRRLGSGKEKNERKDYPTERRGREREKGEEEKRSRWPKLDQSISLGHRLLSIHIAEQLSS